MPRYHYDVSISRQKRFIRRFKKFLLICLGIVVIAGVIIGIDSIRQVTEEQNDEGAPSTSVVRSPIREFDTNYFSFTAPSNWRNIREETTDQVYVYRSYRGDLVENELKVYVNMDPDLTATRVIPVRVEDETYNIVPGQVSDHCSEAANVKTAKEPVTVTMDLATFQCIVDGTNFVVVVAEKGGSTSLELMRSNGTVTNYSFLYRSSTTPPETVQLIDILNSFTAI